MAQKLKGTHTHKARYAKISFLYAVRAQGSCLYTTQTAEVINIINKISI